MTAGRQDRATVLVVDDEPGICRALSEYLAAEGHVALTASNAEEGLKLASLGPQVAFVDLRLPGMDGLSLLKQLRSLRPDLQIVLITAFGGTDAAIQATQAGAYAYLPKPFDIDEVGRIVRRALARPPVAVIPAEPRALAPWELALVGPSAPASRLRDQIRACARDSAPVALVGEFGSGRESAAQSLYASRPFLTVPFLSIHCGTLETGEMDAVLDQMAGDSPRFWFLVEAQDLGATTLASLLQRVSCAGRDACCRVVASLRSDSDLKTWAPLLEEARRRGWSVVDVPPLRQRRDDLPALVSLLLARVNRELDRRIRGMDVGALAALGRYAWPGNLRELENTIRAATVATRDDVIVVEALPHSVSSGAAGDGRPADGPFRSQLPDIRNGGAR